MHAILKYSITSDDIHALHDSYNKQDHHIARHSGAQLFFCVFQCFLSIMLDVPISKYNNVAFEKVNYLLYYNYF